MFTCSLFTDDELISKINVEDNRPIPRIGEQIILDDTVYTIDRILHYFCETPCKVIIFVSEYYESFEEEEERVISEGIFEEEE